jgi:hypothetical protein
MSILTPPSTCGMSPAGTLRSSDTFLSNCERTSIGKPSFFFCRGPVYPQATKNCLGTDKSPPPQQSSTFKLPNSPRQWTFAIVDIKLIWPIVPLQWLTPAFLTYHTLQVRPGREAGVYSAMQLEEADCTLTPWRCHSSPEAPSHQAARERSTSEGGNFYRMNSASNSQFIAIARFIYMPQSWDMGQII